MNKRKVYNKASKKECKHSGPISTPTSKIPSRSWRIACKGSLFMMLFAKVSQAPAPAGLSWH